MRRPSTQASAERRPRAGIRETPRPSTPRYLSTAAARTDGKDPQGAKCRARMSEAKGPGLKAKATVRVLSSPPLPEASGTGGHTRLGLPGPHSPGFPLPCPATLPSHSSSKAGAPLSPGWARSGWTPSLLASCPLHLPPHFRWKHLPAGTLCK